MISFAFFVCACVSANVSEKIRRMIWRGREKEMCIYVDVFLSRHVLFNARMTLWPTVSGFRIFDKIQRSMGVKRVRKRNGVFIFSNKHTRQKKWSCSFIHFNPHSNEMCPSFLISTHTHRHSLIFQQEHTLSLPAHSFAVHQMMMAIERENKSMALMTDTHKCRQESIEWSMSHPKRSLTAQRGEREDWLSS